MAYSINQIKKYRRWFLWGFFASLLLSVVANLNPVVFDSPGNDTLWSSRPPWWFETQTVLAGGAILTSFTTFIGLVVTTIITWRKERREGNLASFELEKKKLELEKLRREVNKTPKRKKKR